MTVAFLSSEYPPHVFGGLGTAVEALSRYLGAAGTEVVLLVPDVGHYAQPPAGVTLLPVPVDGATSDLDYWLRYCRSALDTALARGLEVDAVHCHDWMTVLGGLGIGRALQAPVVMSVHLPQSEPSHLTLENIGLTACDAVLVNSRDVREQLAVRENVGGELAVIPNGVDLAWFTPTQVPLGSQLILFVGRLVPSKGADVLLRAFGAILRRHPEATLVIAGDGEQRLYLERLARFLGIRQHVSFPGWQSRSQLRALYRACAVSCAPSLYEPFGLVALEAMACARPVVVSRVGGLAETVEDGLSGFVVEPGDHLELAARIAELMSDARLAAAAGAAARRRAELFDWTVIADRTTQLYESLGTRTRPGWDGIDQILDGAGMDLRERALAILSPRPVLERGDHER